MYLSKDSWNRNLCLPNNHQYGIPFSARTSSVFHSLKIWTKTRKSGIHVLPLPLWLQSSTRITSSISSIAEFWKILWSVWSMSITCSLSWNVMIIEALGKTLRSYVLFLHLKYIMTLWTQWEKRRKLKKVTAICSPCYKMESLISAYSIISQIHANGRTSMLDLPHFTPNTQHLLQVDQLSLP